MKREFKVRMWRETAETMLSRWMATKQQKLGLRLKGMRIFERAF